MTDTVGKHIFNRFLHLAIWVTKAGFVDLDLKCAWLPSEMMRPSLEVTSNKETTTETVSWLRSGN